MNAFTIRKGGCELTLKEVLMEGVGWLGQRRVASRWTEEAFVRVPTLVKAQRGRLDGTVKGKEEACEAGVEESS